MGHDATNGQRLLQRIQKRNRFPRGHPAAALFRPGGGRRGELRGDRRGDRARNHPRLRRPGPEQRFFLSLAQLWHTNWREAELRRRITVDPHSPGQFRAIGPHVNLQEFYDAFGIKEGTPMWKAPEMRAKIW